MRLLLWMSLLFAALLIAVKVGLSLAGLDAAFAAAPGVKQAQTVIDEVSSGAWAFGQPFLQMIIVLVIGEWFVSRLGLKVSALGAGAINIQTFIAVVVVFTFCLAALGNLPGLPFMKDIVLIVIGFYFGSRSRQDAGAAQDGKPSDGS